MRILLLVFSILWFILGVLAVLSAKTSVGEIQGGICMVVSAIFLSGAAIVEAVHRVGAALKTP